MSFRIQKPQPLLGLLFLLLNWNAFALESRPDTIESLAKSEQWLFLMHYQPSTWGGYKGLATSPKFYAHPEGRTHPKKELQALVQLFNEAHQNSYKVDQHPRCRFPFRFKWLKRNLKGFAPTESPANCELYDLYIDKHNAKSIGISFSSYNVNSPSSAFGHTLIKVSSNKNLNDHSKKTELLDRGINYASNIPDGVNPIWYAVGGLAGFFPGTFSSVPYYFKVREYNDYEARDIWTYHLDLNQTEVDDLMDQLWELGNSPYDYYFLTENCAYYVLRGLQAAVPRIQVMDKVPFWMIPGDTVRALAKVPGLVKAVDYRPSIRTQVFARLDKLNPDQAEWVKDLASNKVNTSALSTFSESQQRDMLDAGLDFIELINPDDYYEKESPSLKAKFKLLQLRARNPLETLSLQIPLPEQAQPDRGHESARWGLVGRTDTLGHFGLGFDMRFALHDVLDGEVGYMRNAGVGFFHIEGTYWEEQNEFILDSFAALEVIALPAYSYYQPNKSWKMIFGHERRIDENCLSACDLFGIELASGRTYALTSQEDLLIYGLITTELKWSRHLPGSDFLAGVGPDVGLLYHWSLNTKSILQYKHYFYLGDQREVYRSGLAELRSTITTNWSLGVSFQNNEGHKSVNLKLFNYF